MRPALAGGGHGDVALGLLQQTVTTRPHDMQPSLLAGLLVAQTEPCAVDRTQLGLHGCRLAADARYGPIDHGPIDHGSAACSAAVEHGRGKSGRRRPCLADLSQVPSGRPTPIWRIWPPASTTRCSALSSPFSTRPWRGSLPRHRALHARGFGPRFLVRHACRRRDTVLGGLHMAACTRVGWAFTATRMRRGVASMGGALTQRWGDVLLQGISAVLRLRSTPSLARFAAPGRERAPISRSRWVLQPC